MEIESCKIMNNMMNFKNKEGFTGLMEQIKLIILFDVNSLVIKS